MPKFEYTPATGVHATILLGMNKKLFLRVYEHTAAYRIEEGRKKGLCLSYDEHAWDHEDYDIYHGDFDIAIEETQCGFYKFADGRKTFDYSPNVLGRISSDFDLVALHKFCKNNRAALLRSVNCGCFYPMAAGKPLPCVLARLAL